MKLEKRDSVGTRPVEKTLPTEPTTGTREAGGDVERSTTTDTSTSSTAVFLTHSNAEARKVVGGVSDARITLHDAGVSGALKGLDLLEQSNTGGTSWRAGTAAALTAFTLMAAPMAHAEDASLNLKLPQTTTTLMHEQVLFDTSVVSAGNTVLATQLMAKSLANKAPTSTSAAAEAAFARFDDVVQSLMRRDAVGLSSLKGPLDDSSQLTPDERTQLESAFKNLIRELPLAALSPDAAQSVKEIAARRGVTVDADTVRIRDLGHAAGDIARTFVDELRHERPAVFWGAAGSIAIAAGAGAIVDGSHVLRAIGVKPEVKVHFLNDQVAAKLTVDWEKRFSNPTVQAALSTPIHLGNLSGEVSAGLIASGPTFGKLDVTGVNLSGNLQGKLENGVVLAAGTNLNLDGAGKLASGTIAATTTYGPWRTTASFTAYDNNHTSTSLGVGYRPAGPTGADWYLQAGRDSQGGNFVGLGVRIPLP